QAQQPCRDQQALPDPSLVEGVFEVCWIAGHRDGDPDRRGPERTCRGQARLVDLLQDVPGAHDDEPPRLAVPAAPRPARDLGQDIDLGVARWLRSELADLPRPQERSDLLEWCRRITHDGRSLPGTCSFDSFICGQHTGPLVDPATEQAYGRQVQRTLGEPTVASYNQTLIDDLRANGGHATSGNFVGRQVLILPTTGAKTGERRETPLAYTRDGDRFVIVASKGGAPSHPAWYHNVVANPAVTVEVDGEQFDAT